jgi:eukaryotic-like serine/threonine-protein kinase
MTLSSGTIVGPYEVLAALGRGGMGEVYRARDTRLGRDVALKILPDSFASDPERLARFEREAQLLASLNHPNIAAIYGLEDGGGLTKALALEIVDGPTLADRVARGPVALDETWSIARQVAQALEAAHDQGIVHRDLKPANIKVRDDGTVKVLDFGLAKAMALPGGEAILSHSPTITTPAMTQAGVLLGTAAYMSPEVAKGRPADRRADIWAFGCVLYELLTGTQTFDGNDMTEVLGAVVRLEPDWGALPRELPVGVVTVLKRCLQKDPNLRLRDIADVRLQLEDALAAPVASARPAAQRLTSAGYAGWAVAAITMVAAIGAAMSRPPAELPETRLQVATPPTNDPFSFALSPDGRTLVFEARVDGQSRLWLRPLESDEARPLMGTNQSGSPFWSPDSRSIAFFADGLLKRIDLESGFVRTVASAPNPRRGAWNDDGTVLFGASVGPLYRVSADGGPVAEATNLLPLQTNHRIPQFLPGGRFLLLTLGAPDVRGVYLSSLSDTSLRRVFDRESAYLFMPSGHVLIVRDGALWARGFNAMEASLGENLVPVAQRVLVSPSTTGFSALSASATGAVAYRTSAGSKQLVWLDRDGRTLESVGQPDDAQLELASLSPDGATAAAVRTVNGNTDVWVLDSQRGVPRRLTFDPHSDATPIFSPDGLRVAYVSDRKADVWDIFERRSDGTGAETLLLESNENKQALAWSSDGRFILYTTQNPQTDYDLWALPLGGERKPIPIAVTPYVEYDARLSPDAHWVAFESTETGQTEIYIQPFPETGPKRQISNGGRRPRWRRDGRELFYISADDRLMAVSISPGNAGLEVGPPRALFALPPTQSFEPSPDGQRFLTTAVVSEASPITIILNWQPPDE